MNAAEVRDRFIGVWRLVSCTRQVNDNVEYPYGEHPVGRITYDRAGRMSAQLMNPERPKPSYVQTVEGVKSAGAEEMRSVLAGYIAYYGNYSVDETNRRVIHHVQSCLHPGWVGTEQIRHYEFDGDRLILRASIGGATNTLIWEREPE